MTTRQLVTLVAGAALVVTMLVFPPWKFALSVPQFPQLRIERPGPYAFVFVPPQIPVTPATRPESVEDIIARGRNPDAYREYFEAYERRYWTARVDFPRLLLPVAAISIVTSVLIIAFRQKRSA